VHNGRKMLLPLRIGGIGRIFRALNRSIRGSAGSVSPKNPNTVLAHKRAADSPAAAPPTRPVEPIFEHGSRRSGRWLDTEACKDERSCFWPALTRTESDRKWTITEPIPVAFVERRFLRPNIRTYKPVRGGASLLLARCVVRYLIYLQRHYLSGFQLPYRRSTLHWKSLFECIRTVAPYLTHLMQENALLMSNIILRS
jgi:hypothetical protein